MAANPVNKIGLDSVVVLDWLSRAQGRFKFIEPIAKEAEDGNLLIVVSIMAIAETYRLDGKSSDRELKIIQDFFDSEHVAPYAVGRNVAERAQLIRREFSVSGIDAIHLATALISQTPILLTNDGAREKASPAPLKPNKLLGLDKKLSHNGMTLRIVTPENYPNLKMSGPGKLPFHPELDQ